MADDALETAYPRPATEEPRNPMGWILLGVIFLALIALQAQSYFTRAPAEPLPAMESRLKTAVESEKSSALTGDQLQPLITDLDSQRVKSDDAERLWVIATYEQKKTVPAADLDRLRSSKLTDGEVLAKIYSAPKLDPKQANRLASLLKPDHRFSSELATMHDLEKAGLPSGRSRLSGNGRLLVGLLLGLFVLGGLVLWVVFGVLKAGGLLPAEGHPVDPLTPAQADAYAMRAGQLMASYVVVSFVVGAFGSKDASLGSRVALQCFAQLAILVVMVWLAKLPIGREKISLRTLGFRSVRPGRDILFGIAATAMNYPVLIGLGVLSNRIFKDLPQPEHPITVELAGHPGPAIIVGLLFSASIAAPLFEETVFRASFLPALSRVLKSRVWGVLITSLLFASIHPTGIPAWPGLAALGAMSCLLVYQTKSLVPSMVMHGLNNAIALAATLALGG